MLFTHTVAEILEQKGISRRQFLNFCATLASLMALPSTMVAKIASALEQARRPSVIWLSFQECTGCTESLTRSDAPTLEGLILDTISLDYHHTLQAAAGEGAEQARIAAMLSQQNQYILVVDGSVPLGNPGFSTIAGISNHDMLLEVAKNASAIVAVGTCAAFGGLPQAYPNPTGAVAIGDIVLDKPLINIPGCPPIPVVITGVLTHILAFGAIPELDSLKRPKAFYGQSIHDRCYRRPFYDLGLFAENFSDEGARKGWCLYKLGCKGPVTYNACATLKWNASTSFPIEAGHPCLGCSENHFWDGGGFYRAISLPSGNTANTAAYAVTAGLAAGVALGTSNRSRKAQAENEHQIITIHTIDKADKKDKA
jgi:hydrogenase small subunit